jgi:hypothetical protein
MKRTKLIITVGLLTLVTGCYTPKHSNVLIFATNTKFGVDISYDPKTQEPSFVVGFRRQEGVWMPLLANFGPDGLEPGPLTVTNNVGGQADVQQIAPHMLYRGNQGNDRDTYSVLATFRGSAAGQTSGTNGGGASSSIAQYFATGLAARELAQRGGAALVSTKAPPPDVEAVSKLMSAINNPDNQKLRDQFDQLLAKPLDKTKAKNADGSPFAGTTSDYANFLAGQIQPGSTWAAIRAYAGDNLQKLIQQLQQVE